jgi:hypothetical protein
VDGAHIFLEPGRRQTARFMLPQQALAHDLQVFEILLELLPRVGAIALNFGGLAELRDGAGRAQRQQKREQDKQNTEFPQPFQPGRR